MSNALGDISNRSSAPASLRAFAKRKSSAELNSLNSLSDNNQVWADYAEPIKPLKSTLCLDLTSFIENAVAQEQEK